MAAANANASLHAQLPERPSVELFGATVVEVEPFPGGLAVVSEAVVVPSPVSSGVVVSASSPAERLVVVVFVVALPAK